MNLKPAVKYQLHDFKKGVGIFYLVIYLVVLFMLIMFATQTSEGESSVNGLEMASMIFLFVGGLNSFKGTFKLFLQNGLSRKTLFVSFGVASAFVALFMDVVDTINNFLFHTFMPSQSIFDQIYGTKYISSPAYIKTFDQFVWFFFLYLFAVFLGYFITSLYYRMNKPQKLALSIGIPVFLFMILPLIDTSLTNGRIYEALGKFIIFIMGFSSANINPYIFVLTCIAASALCGGLSYLLGRKAMIKES